MGQNEFDRARAYLSKLNMDSSKFSMKELVELFNGEVSRGLAGMGTSSLLMLPTFIEAKAEIPLDKKVLALDAGGTNLRSAIVSFNKNREALITNFSKNIMPGVEKEVNAVEFYDALANQVCDIADKASQIGFCFSYATKSMVNKDGQIIKTCKEIKAPNIEGTLVGKNLLEALKKMGKKINHSVVILNDTVATLLSGLAQSSFIEDVHIGLICGTGYNIAYVENNSNIKNIDEKLTDGFQIINTEIGNFNLIPRSKVDLDFDKTTSEEGSYILEKAVAGAYLGQLFYFLLKQAGQDGNFTSSEMVKVYGLAKLSTKSFGDFLLKKESELDSIFTQNKEFALCLAELLVDRAALFIAASLASLSLRSCELANKKSVVVTVEGTTFYKIKGLRERTQGYLASFLNDNYRISLKLNKAENASLIGAAIAALTNRSN